MKTIYAILTLLTIFASGIKAQNKQFCNLTADDVKIDSVLPRVAYSYPLPANYSDSTYSVTLKYPEFLDMSAADVEAYKTLNDELPPSMPDITTAQVFSRKKGTLLAEFCPVVYRDGKYQYLVSYMVEFSSKPNNDATADYASARTMKKAGSDAASRYASNSILAKGKWAKIRVSESGVYQLTEATIKRAGFSDLSKVKIYGYGGNLVPETLTPAYIESYDDLKEVPTCTVNGRRLFYANGPLYWSSNSTTTNVRNPYSDYGYYFITQSEGTPASISEEDFEKAIYPQPQHYHEHYEKDEYAWYEGGRRLFEKASIGTGSSKDYNIAVPSGNTSAKFSVAATGNTAGNIQVLINDSVVGTLKISIGDHDKANLATATYNVSKNLKAVNKVTIKNVSCTDVRLDYITATFTTPKAKPSIKEDNFPQAEYVHNITNQNHHADPQCDMVIIIPTAQHTLAQALQLKEYHEKKDSLRINIVPADELYNEFSSGTPDASAYKRYMKMLYDRAETDKDAPKYLLLFGDCVWDNRLLTSATSSLNHDKLLLCYESDNSYSSVNCFVSDDFFAMLDDNEAINSSTSFLGIPDVGVGRLPVSGTTDAQIAVNKIIYYGNNSHDAAWQNTIMFLGDDGNNNIHMTDINTVADNVAKEHPGYNIRKIMWDAYNRVSSSNGNRYPEVASIIKKQQADGALIIDYGGHGKASAISHEYVLTLNDVNNFRGNNFPLWVTASCDIAPFDGTEANIGESAVLNAKGGAIAFYGTTRTVISNYNKHINNLFMKYVLSTDENGRMITLGEANRLTKEALVNSGLDTRINKMQYSLLGDPALSLACPQLSVVIDSINGVSTSSETLPQLKAGSIARVKGHIGTDKSTVTDFNGLMSAIVNDSRQHIVCKLNDTSKDGASKAFEYDDYTNIIYQGNDSVKNGEFSFLFAVPKDINYSDAAGLMTIYAYNNEKTKSAHGSCDKFIVGGSDLATNDSIGPSIYCYLNSPDFTNGGTVNSTPYFVAEIMDEDGINASGSGIGHDLQLTIDGQAAMTFSLNDNFQFDFGSYTSGQTYYILPTLAPGPHSLRFRAWDIQNNSSTTQLNFVVQSGVKPSINTIYATPNPASDSVTFVINHDRPGTNISVAVDVMDAAGRLLWSSEETGASANTSYNLTWNLTTASGAKLQTGVYLYRIRMSCDGSDSVSKAKKLIVVRR